MLSIVFYSKYSITGQVGLSHVCEFLSALQDLSIVNIKCVVTMRYSWKGSRGKYCIRWTNNSCWNISRLLSACALVKFMVEEALFARARCFLFVELILVYNFVKSARLKKKKEKKWRSEKFWKGRIWQEQFLAHCLVLLFLKLGILF